MCEIFGNETSACFLPTPDRHFGTDGSLPAPWIDNRNVSRPHGAWSELPGRPRGCDWRIITFMVPDENLEHTSGSGILNKHLCICMKMYENILRIWITYTLEVQRPILDRSRNGDLLRYFGDLFRMYRDNTQNYAIWTSRIYLSNGKVSARCRTTGSSMVT